MLKIFLALLACFVVGCAASSPKATVSGAGFASAERLEEHFYKHGAEFGAANAEAYLALAQKLRDAPVGGNIEEAKRASDGVLTRYDRGTGAFIAFDQDGTIRTFFKPNDEGYFRRQLNRRHD